MSLTAPLIETFTACTDRGWSYNNFVTQYYWTNNNTIRPEVFCEEGFFR